MTSGTSMSGGQRDELLADIREALAGVTARFDRSYFMDKARADGSMDELWRDLADKGLLGVGVPEEHGGAGGGLISHGRPPRSCLRWCPSPGAPHWSR